MTTFMAKAEEIDRKWYLVDATDLVLGRLAAQVAFRLRGKHKPEFTPHCDTGDHIIVINADKIRVTARKADDKMYHRHSGHMGGLKTMNFNEMQQKHPGKVLEIAVKGMLPRGPLGRKMLSKLKVYAGDEHAHSAQQPEVLRFEEDK